MAQSRAGLFWSSGAGGVDPLTDEMGEDEMALLHPGCLRYRDDESMVDKTRDLAAIPATEADRDGPDLASGMDGSNDVRRPAAGAEAQNGVAGCHQSHDLTTEDLVERVVVSDRGDQPGIRRERNAADRRSIAPVVREQLGREMLRRKGAAAVAAREDAPAISQHINQHPRDALELTERAADPIHDP